MSWEERMSQKAQARRTLPEPPTREPDWRDYWWRPRIGYVVAGWAIPYSWNWRLPRRLCMDCLEWTGHNWRQTCGRFRGGCDHRHHDLEIWIA